jgi:hypothetical protein
VTEQQCKIVNEEQCEEVEEEKCRYLKGLSHEMDLAVDDMYGGGGLSMRYSAPGFLCTPSLYE